MRHERQMSGMVGFKNIALSQKVARCILRSSGSGSQLRRATREELRHACEKMRAQTPLATDDVIDDLILTNADIVRVVRPKDSSAPPLGLIAYLPLNESGAEAIARGIFNGTSPASHWLCAAGVEPVALYVWLVYMPASFGRCLAALATAFDEVCPNGCPIFTRSTNERSARLGKAMGFQPAQHLYPNCSSDLVVALPQKEAPLIVQSKTTAIAVARTFEDIAKVFAIRSSTYIAQQFCHYAEEFDGNDFCATHLLGTINGDPAGCVRIRFFAGFAKIERLAVRTEYRQSRLAFLLARQAVKHCQNKGYCVIYGHSRRDLVKFWQVFGFRARPNRGAFSFANIEYIELILNCDPSNDAITLDDAPLKLVRPEGAWDQSGPLDDSLSEHDIDRVQLIKNNTRTIRRSDVTLMRGRGCN